MITLRPYQQAAVDAVYQHLATRDDNPCVVIPTGGGKTPCIATICNDAVNKWGGRVLVLAHVKELLEQNAEKIRMFMGCLGVGVYSAGLKSRDTDSPVIVAGIQSAYNKACDLGRFDIILIDEVHLLPPDGEGMYRTFLADAKIINPGVRIIGFTATPFRLKDGMICAPENILNHVCFEIGVKELIRDGYLSPLISRAGLAKADTTNLHIRAGEFMADEVEALMDGDALVEAACAEIADLTKARKAVLIFCAGVKHAQHVAQQLREKHGIAIEVVTGDTPTAERDRIVADFKSGKLRYLANVNVLTTGFDAPHVDCVVMLRPTLSAGLYYQMCLDMETEVLTPGGWRRCHEVVTGDDVGAFNCETGEISYVKALGKVHRALHRDELMVGVKSPHLDFRITDNHNMIVKSRSHSALYWQLQPAKLAAQRKENFLIPIAGKGEQSHLEAPLTDAEVAFLGWFLTDGYHNPIINTITISQSKVKFHQIVRETLIACGFGFGEYEIKRSDQFAEYENGINFVIPHGQPRGDRKDLRGWEHLAPWIDKDVPAIYGLLSRRQFGILLQAMNLANGTHPKGQSWTKRTMDIHVGCRQRMADRIQQLAIERGFRCNVVCFEPRPSSWNKTPQRQWQLHIRDQINATIGGINIRANTLIPNRCRIEPLPKDSNEWVWCLTTELGTLVTRRNGKVAILGNCGRGLRLAPDKKDCLVLDYGGNVLRHGPVDQLLINTEERGKGTGEAPAKECPECHTIVAAAYARCPQCGYEFPPPERKKHDAKASAAGVLSGQFVDTEYPVKSVMYGVHTKRGGTEQTPKTLRVEYEVGFNQWQKEWVCVEHQGFARNKADLWWKERSHHPCPKTAGEAAKLARQGVLAEPTHITVRETAGEDFPRIIAWRLGGKPAMREPGADEEEAVSVSAVQCDEDDHPPF